MSKLYLIPPFSILDTQKKNWQERQRNWKGYFNSGSGRNDDLLGGIQNLCRHKKTNLTGTSVFDPVLCEILYQWICPIGGNILDPFAGGSVRGLVASFLGRRYTGIDLSEKQIEDNNTQYETIKDRKDFTNNTLRKPNWIIGDSHDIKNLVGGEQYDFLISCPPYFDLERYSNKDTDLSNLDWDSFINSYNQIFKDAVSLLKDDCFIAIVIGEVRDNKGIYRNLVGETVKALTAANCSYYNEAILVNSYTTAVLRAKRMFNSGRKLCKVHQNVLIFVKGDYKKATQKLSNEINWFKNVEEEFDRCL